MACPVRVVDQRHHPPWCFDSNRRCAITSPPARGCPTRPFTSVRTVDSTSPSPPPASSSGATYFSLAARSRSSLRRGCAPWCRRSFGQLSTAMESTPCRARVRRPASRMFSVLMVTNSPADCGAEPPNERTRPSIPRFLNVCAWARPLAARPTGTVSLRSRRPRAGSSQRSRRRKPVTPRSLLRTIWAPDA